VGGGITSSALLSSARLPSSTAQHSTAQLQAASQHQHVPRLAASGWPHISAWRSAQSRASPSGGSLGSCWRGERGGLAGVGRGCQQEGRVWAAHAQATLTSRSPQRPGRTRASPA
jgi:hypothetical protein